MAPWRRSRIFRGPVGSVGLSLLLLGVGCKDAQKPQEAPPPAPSVAAVARAVLPPATLQFTDVTAASHPG